jgi:hypothetical protein
VANIAVGNGPLTALQGSEGKATDATCYSSTVSNAPAASTPTSAICDITYSDGSIWGQTVTITLDSQANPVSDSTNGGTELLAPGDTDAGYDPNYQNYLNAENQAQDEMTGAIDAQGPGITSDPDNDAGTGGDYDGSDDSGG